MQLWVGLVALLFRLLPWVVYADAASFDRRFFRVVTQWVGAHPAVDYHPRRRGKQQWTTPFFIGPWRRPVLGPRGAIERHFARLKRHFRLKDFQGDTLARVTQDVLLT
ncbi:MAG TPA: hypothetical protein EYP54_10660 [Anaerolineales bacterium]|nr:hypothetical protein [Anaerolineales bacterium]